MNRPSLNSWQAWRAVPYHASAAPGREIKWSGTRRGSGITVSGERLHVIDRCYLVPITSTAAWRGVRLQRFLTEGPEPLRPPLTFDVAQSVGANCHDLTDFRCTLTDNKTKSELLLRFAERIMPTTSSISSIEGRPTRGTILEISIAGVTGHVLVVSDDTMNAFHPLRLSLIVRLDCYTLGDEEDDTLHVLLPSETGLPTPRSVDCVLLRPLDYDAAYGKTIARIPEEPHMREVTRKIFALLAEQ